MMLENKICQFETYLDEQCIDTEVISIKNCEESCAGEEAGSVRNVEMNKWDSDIESMKLSRLRDTSNKHLMPCVLCPWGCSEFYHQ